MKQAVFLWMICLRAALVRPGSSLLIVVATGGAVVVLCFFLSMSEGLQASMIAAGREDRAVVLRRGSETELNSGLPADVDRVLLSRPEIATLSGGPALYSREILRVLNIDTPSGAVTFPIRGVDSRHADVRPEWKIIEGRMFTPGRNELVIGRAIRSAERSLKVGRTIDMKGAAWEITGVFSTDRSAHESEIFCDLLTLKSFFQMDHISAVTVRLNSAQSFAAFKAAVESDRAIAAQAHNERDYYEKLSEKSGAPLKVVATLVGGLMALAAIFASTNATSATVASRNREIATLRALGFAPAAILASLILEVVTLCLLGAGVGLAIAWLAFDDSAIAMLTGDARMNQTAFQLQLTLDAILVSVLCALGTGVLSALSPSWAAIKENLAVRLRSA